MTTVEAIIDQTVSDILGNWASVTVTPKPTPTLKFINGSQFLCARLSFSGVVNGHYTVAFPPDLAATIASRVLGSDEQPHVDLVIGDMLKELINIISGNLLAACYGQDTGFDLVLPEAFRSNYFPAEELGDRSFFYEAEGQPFAVVYGNSSSQTDNEI